MLPVGNLYLLYLAGKTIYQVVLNHFQRVSNQFLSHQRMSLLVDECVVVETVVVAAVAIDVAETADDTVTDVEPKDNLPVTFEVHRNRQAQQDYAHIEIEEQAVSAAVAVDKDKPVLSALGASAEFEAAVDDFDSRLEQLLDSVGRQCFASVRQGTVDYCCHNSIAAVVLAAVAADDEFVGCAVGVEGRSVAVLAVVAAGAAAAAAEIQ